MRQILFAITFLVILNLYRKIRNYDKIPDKSNIKITILKSTTQVNGLLKIVFALNIYKNLVIPFILT
jgi:hypothetical protein